MAETINISAIAERISADIFKHFKWRLHPKRDDNFQCNNPEHVGGKNDKAKDTHPGDAVFYYDDPYLTKRIYLHTDLKSYAKRSISADKIRSALKSLAMTIDCAVCSADWRLKYSVDDDEPHEVRGLLFVHNHDGKYIQSFHDAVAGSGTAHLPLPVDGIIHFLGPADIQRLFNITNDLIRLGSDGLFPTDKSKYTFYYPDLVLHRRHGDIWGQPATIEALTGPFLILKYRDDEGPSKSGYVIYYNRNGDGPEEFEYFLDCLSRFQLLDSGEQIRVRVTTEGANAELKSIFETAKKRYSKAWGFDPARTSIVEAIQIERITGIANTYNPGEIGWRI